MTEHEINEKVRKHNEKVDYNNTVSSWIIDIMACIIFFPIIIMIIYRRGKYNSYKEFMK